MFQLSNDGDSEDFFYLYRASSCASQNWRQSTIFVSRMLVFFYWLLWCIFGSSFCQVNISNPQFLVESKTCQCSCLSFCVIRKHLDDVSLVCSPLVLTLKTQMKTDGILFMLTPSMTTVSHFFVHYPVLQEHLEVIGQKSGACELHDFSPNDQQIRGTYCQYLKMNGNKCYLAWAVNNQHIWM